MLGSMNCYYNIIKPGDFRKGMHHKVVLAGLFKVNVLIGALETNVREFFGFIFSKVRNSWKFSVAHTVKYAKP